jgi:hypothetical protein
MVVVGKHLPVRARHCPVIGSEMRFGSVRSGWDGPRGALAPFREQSFLGVYQQVIFVCLRSFDETDIY